MADQVVSMIRSLPLAVLTLRLDLALSRPTRHSHVVGRIWLSTKPAGAKEKSREPAFVFTRLLPGIEADDAFWVARVEMIDQVASLLELR